MWDSESESVAGREYKNGLVSSSKQGVKTDGFEQRGQSWYVNNVEKRSLRELPIKLER